MQLIQLTVAAVSFSGLSDGVRSFARDKLANKPCETFRVLQLREVPSARKLMPTGFRKVGSRGTLVGAAVGRVCRTPDDHGWETDGTKRR